MPKLSSKEEFVLNSRNYVIDLNAPTMPDLPDGMIWYLSFLHGSYLYGYRLEAGNWGLTKKKWYKKPEKVFIPKLASRRLFDLDDNYYKTDWKSTQKYIESVANDLMDTWAKKIKRREEQNIVKQHINSEAPHAS